MYRFIKVLKRCNRTFLTTISQGFDVYKKVLSLKVAYQLSIFEHIKIPITY